MRWCRRRVPLSGDRAYYQSSTDHIQLSDEGLFAGTKTLTRDEGYYATLLHELVHWTGAHARLGRDMSKRFGDQAHAAEELVAEIGAAFLCAELAITQDVRPDKMNSAKASFTRYAEPDEIADAVGFLASARSKFINGQVLRVDGGLTLFPG